MFISNGSASKALKDIFPFLSSAIFACYELAWLHESYVSGVKCVSDVIVDSNVEIIFWIFISQKDSTFFKLRINVTLNFSHTRLLHFVIDTVIKAHRRLSISVTVSLYLSVKKAVQYFKY